MKNKKATKAVARSNGTTSPSANGTARKIFLAGWHPYAWIALAVFLVFSQTLFFQFSYFDDNHLVISRYDFLKNPANAGRLFFENTIPNFKGMFFYRPLMVLSLMTDTIIGGEGPFIYHLTNVLIHIAVCLLLFVLFEKLGYGRWKSFLVVLLFGGHPAITQAVAWIPGRNDTLLGLGSLLSLLGLVNYSQKADWRWGALSILALGAALFTKETAIVLLAIFLVYQLIVQPNRTVDKKTWFLWIGWIAITAGWFILRSIALKQSGDTAVAGFYGIAQIASGFFSYLGKTFWPAQLSPITDVKDLVVLPGIVILLMLLAAILVWGVGRRGYFIMGGVWLLVFVLPVITLVPGTNSFLDQRFYLPLMGFLLLLMELKAIDKFSGYQRAAKIVFPLILIAMSVKTVTYSRTFRDDVAVARQVVMMSPHSLLAADLMGYVYERHEDYKEAEKYYIKALKLSPADPLALANLNNLYNILGDSEFSGQNRSDFNLGTLYLKAGILDSSRWYLQKAIEQNPQLPKANYNLGQVYERLKKIDSAALCYLREEEVNPKYTEAYLCLGVVYQNSGKYSLALGQYQKASNLHAEDAGINTNIGTVYQLQGDLSAAERMYKKAISSNPNFIEAHYNLGML